MKFDGYDPGATFDEMFQSPGRPWPGTSLLAQRLEALAPGELSRRQQAAERALLSMGITFNVYGHTDGAEKIFPFDIVPRVIDAATWSTLSAGLAQRVRALNLFIADVYDRQRVLDDGVVPRTLIESAAGYLRPCRGLKPPNGVWCHITGTDLVRDRDGSFYVLEDNLRCPSGVSYVLENRRVMKHTLPRVFEASRVRPVDVYPGRLLDALQRLSPRGPDATVVVLSPGRFNSAYFEHSFLARQMGVELVEGGDLVARDGAVWMRTTHGFDRVDVIYRRIDDTFIDPRAFRADSLLGVPGLMEVYAAGGVALANAPGTGVADDKVVYAYVPEMIRYYLHEEPLLPNVPTYICSNPRDLEQVLDRLDALVVKCANESGGYGMLIGPASTVEERARFAALLRANPRNYIAQPTLDLSRVPTLVGDHFEPRHVDLRPYVLHRGGDDVWVLPGGLTRVALRKGSLVVNSSQGGGSKDTWVLDEPVASQRQWQSQGGQSQSQGGDPC